MSPSPPFYVWILAPLTAAALIGACSAEEEKKKSDDDDNHGGGGSSSTTSTTTSWTPSQGGGTFESCEEKCVGLFPAGAVDFDVLRNCIVCDACYEICTTEIPYLCEDVGPPPRIGAGGAGGAGPPWGGCSATDGASCEICVLSACAVEQLPDTSFVGYCAEPAEVCAANPDCVRLNNCLYTCMEQGAGGAGGMM